MCGIAGVHFFRPHRRHGVSNKNLEDMTDALLLGIEERGGHATGVACMDKFGNSMVYKKDIPAEKFIENRDKLPKNVQTILLHTRFKTKGAVENPLNNHPVKYGSAIVTHNGHIINDDDLFEDEKLERFAEVDTEIIAALFDKYGIDKAHIPLQKLDGNLAVAVLDERNPGSLVLAKGKSSPLTYHVSDSYIVWASEASILRDTYNLVYNRELEYKDIKHLTEGDILYFEKGAMDKLNFKVYRKPYTPTTPSQFHREKHGYSTAWSSREDDDVFGDWPGVRVLGHNQPEKPVNRIYLYQNGQTLEMSDCEGCREQIEVKDLEKIGDEWFCNTCIEGQGETLFSASVEVVEGDDCVVEQDDTDDLEEEHMVICELVADHMGLTTEIVDVILFNEDFIDVEMKNETFKEIIEECSELYKSLYRDLVENIKSTARVYA